jgi:putative spermidine/putrescine transport system ATP-binding protein/spermidine/putrescine transport system ATP-binding protein
MIAGLVEPNAGDIFIDDRRITRVPVHRRNIGMLYQNYALFPQMTVAENIAFGLETRGVKGAAAAARVQGALQLVQLSGYGDRLPSLRAIGSQVTVALRPESIALTPPARANGDAIPNTTPAIVE